MARFRVLPQYEHVMPGYFHGPEQSLRVSFARGEFVDLRPGDAAEDDVGRGAAWEPGRTIRAEVLRGVLLGAYTQEPGFTAALRLRGVRVAGLLDLRGANVHAAGYPYSVQTARFYVRAALGYHDLGHYAGDIETVTSDSSATQ